ncbi:hypothetical protein H2248_007819 [Termitomyces sp. 'cryptogamus']|nr:hypothetical protein H2248_007819 [Termitomyces sp. 'cryptogamus']
MVMLHDTPPDILIRICSHLELPHVLSFVSTCSSLRHLADSKSLWINVLERTGRIRNLACPIGTDLSEMTVSELRRVARHTNKLEHNWGRAKPYMARSVRTAQYSYVENGEPAAILAAIPATSLVVLYLKEHKQILVCDSEGQMPLQRIHVGKIRRRAHFDDSGRHLIAVLAADLDIWGDTISLKVISIDYCEGGKTISIREVFHSTPPSQYLHGPLFVAPDLVGLLCDVDEGRSFIHIINFTRKFSVDIPITSSYLTDDRSISLSVVDRRLFIISAWNNDDTGYETYDIHFCPVEKLSSEENLSWTEIATEIGANIVHAAQMVVSNHTRGFDRETVELKLSRVGYHALHVVYPELHAGLTYASFWPIEQLGTRNIQSTKYGGTINIEGKIGSHHYDYSAPWLVASSHSGIYSVLILQHADQDPQLCLLQRDSSPPAIHVRTLDVPRYIDLKEVYAVAIEDRYGVVYLSHAHGYLFALPYA